MKKVFSIFFLSVFLFSLAGFVFVEIGAPSSVSAACQTTSGKSCPDCPQQGGFVPCGRSCDDTKTEDKCECEPCTICDFFVLISNIISFFLGKIIPPLAVLLLAVGGGMYMVAYMSPGAGPGLISRAKSVIVSTLIGLVIIYGAFIIVGTFLSLIGLADWTKNIYGDWMSGHFFKINCGG